MASKTLNYFRLYSSKPSAAASSPPKAAPPGNSPSTLWSIAHFICLILGILAYFFLRSFQNGTSFKISIPLIIFSAIAAIAIFPKVFKKSFNTDDPRLIQLCLTFAGGIGYQSLFMIGEKLVQG